MKKTIGQWDFYTPLEQTPFYGCTLSITQEDPPWRTASEMVTISMDEVQDNPSSQALIDLVEARLEMARIGLEYRINNAPDIPRG